MLLVKIMLNSIISTPGAKFMTIDIASFYLPTLIEQYKRIKLKLSTLPGEIIPEYKLLSIAMSDGLVYVEVRKIMYGLPQAGQLVNELLKKWLNKHDYYQCKIVPGLWTHKTWPISFTLVVDNFWVKYVGEKHTKHLMSVLRESYNITHKWKGEKYISITIDCDYQQRQVHLSMPGYVDKALQQFNHPYPTKRRDSPYPCTSIKYGAKIQYAKTAVDVQSVSEADKNYILQVCKKFLFYGRAVDSTVLTALSVIASQQAKPTTYAMAKTRQFLDYLASQEEAILTYSASNMVSAVHSNARYLNDLKARSTAGGHFFLSTNAKVPTNNGAILNVAQIMKNVMSSAAEAKLGAIYIMAREAVNIRHIPKEMGHK